jgi:hypothetical protein
MLAYDDGTPLSADNKYDFVCVLHRYSEIAIWRLTTSSIVKRITTSAIVIQLSKIVLRLRIVCICRFQWPFFRFLRIFLGFQHQLIACCVFPTPCCFTRESMLDRSSTTKTALFVRILQQRQPINTLQLLLDNQFDSLPIIFDGLFTAFFNVWNS